MRENALIIEKTLKNFGITAEVVEVNLGPAVTQYVVDVPKKNSYCRISSWANELAYALAAPKGFIRMEVPVPGREYVGIEIPNISPETISLKGILEGRGMSERKDKLTVPLGLDVRGMSDTVNLADLHNILIAGSDNTEIKILIDSWIASLLLRTSPYDVRFVLIDLDNMGLSLYEGIPHLIHPVIKTPDKALASLKNTLAVLDGRYRTFAESGIHNISKYNDNVMNEKMPRIVIIISDLAQLMAYDRKKTEDLICSLTRIGSVHGIHLIITTREPSSDVFTDLIKKNIPVRIAFQMPSIKASQVILDIPGAQLLLGNGDMLYIPPDKAKIMRVQSVTVSEHEVKNLVDFLDKK